MNKSTSDLDVVCTKTPSGALADLPSFEVRGIWGGSEEHARRNAVLVARWLQLYAKDGGTNHFEPVPLR